MFSLFSSTYSKAYDFLSSAVEIAAAVPKVIIAECNRYEITPGALVTEVANSAATYGAEALLLTVSFAAKASDYALKSTWDGAVAYAPPLAEATWNGLKTYGLPTTKTLGDYAMSMATNAWNAAQWSANEISKFADEHQLKERAFAAAKELANEAKAALDLICGKPIEFTDLTIAPYHNNPTEYEDLTAIAAPSTAVNESDVQDESFAPSFDASCAGLIGSDALFFSSHSVVSVY